MPNMTDTSAQPPSGGESSSGSHSYGGAVDSNKEEEKKATTDTGTKSEADNQSSANEASAVGNAVQ